MNRMKMLTILCCLALIAGCASMFGRSSDDPALELQWASEDFSTRDQPVEAERLILDAVKLYQKSGDRLGKAEAYRQYGLFLRSLAVEKFKEHYVTEGFQDETITFAKRYEKAIEYFLKSREIFAEYGSFDKLSNIDVSLAKTYSQLNRNEEACDSLTRSVNNYNAYKKANPEMKEFHAEELADYEEYIGIVKKQLACPETPAKEKKEEVKEEPKEDKKPINSHSMGFPDTGGEPKDEKKPVGSHSMGAPE